MALSFRGKINSSQLIEEVKKRPCLYDGRGTHYNHDTKNAAWGEIALALFQNQWHEFSPADKDCLVKDMQVKWKSLRDNYSRQLRIQKQKGNSTNPQKKYIYMDQLSFLKPHFLKRDKISLSDDSKDSIDSLINSCDDTKHLANVSSSSVELPEDFISQSTLRFVPIQPKSKPFVPAVTPIEITNYNQHYEPSAEPPMKKVARCLEELTNFHKEMKSDDPMGNKKFLLSLLPFMKKLPDDVNLEVRLQLMGVLETYVNGKN